MDAIYQQKILHFVHKAIDANIIEKENIELPYCTQCDCWLIDALIDGYCPFCHKESHGVCENCGMVVSPQDLLQTTCARCSNPSSKKAASVYTFELSKYLYSIQSKLLQRDLPSYIQLLIKKVLNLKNYKILVTYPDKNDKGLRLTGTNQIVHVWFEMAAHYEQFALNQAYWIHCFGFDNSFYYLLFIPALLNALNPLAKLPDAVVTNHFLHLEGLKFSTSRSHALWVDEFSGNTDHLRLYLSLYRPAVLTDNFSMEEFLQFSSMLSQHLKLLQQRAQIVAKQEHSKVILQKLIDCNRITREMEFYLSPTQLDLRRASRKLMCLLDLALQSINTGSTERMLLHTLATLMLPFMPREAEYLLRILIKIDSPLLWIKDWSSVYAVA